MNTSHKEDLRSAWESYRDEFDPLITYGDFTNLVSPQLPATINKNSFIEKIKNNKDIKPILLTFLAMLTLFPFLKIITLPMSIFAAMSTCVFLLIKRRLNR